MFSRTCRLNRRIERKKVGLLGNAAYELYNVVNLEHLGIERVDFIDAPLGYFACRLKLLVSLFTDYRRLFAFLGRKLSLLHDLLRRARYLLDGCRQVGYAHAYARELVIEIVHVVGGIAGICGEFFRRGYDIVVVPAQTLGGLLDTRGLVADAVNDTSERVDRPVEVLLERRQRIVLLNLGMRDEVAVGKPDHFIGDELCTLLKICGFLFCRRNQVADIVLVTAQFRNLVIDDEDIRDLVIRSENRDGVFL